MASPTPRQWRNYRLAVCLALFLSVPVGFGVKYYRGPFQAWFNDAFGGAIYEMFWIFLAVAIAPQLSPTLVAIAVFVATSLLEVLQLWHPAWLEGIRATFVGRTLLGTTFSWWDFPHYALGCLLGWGVLKWFQNKILPTRSPDSQD